MFCHRTTYRVIYGDTDNMGQAYYGNYFRWFEIGRSEMFRSLGLPYKAVEDNGIFLPVAESHCKYETPAKYDDILVIETSLDDKFRASLKFDYKIYREDGQTLIARGYTKHPCVNREGKVVRPPKFLKDVIAKTLTVANQDSN
jgi:acyl-CoA thioester hydrolase